jgi:hypothetical protein
MKKLLIVSAAVLVVFALIAWVASWFRAPEAVAASAAQEWPGGLGTLEAVEKRFPPAQGNEASRTLMPLLRALAQNEAIDAYVAREMARGDLTIGEPPALPDVSAVREVVLREPIVWERREGFDHPDTQNMRGMHMTTARALIANALAKGRAGDPAAWNDLHAVWKLARTLEAHPQMLLQTAALSMARMINAVAWKMPLPVPEWFAELQARDSVRPLLEAFQYQAASYWQSGTEMFPTKMLATSVEHDRRIAEQVFKTTQCDVTTPMNKLGVDLTSVWRRAFRYRAEREATANALRARTGQPIESRSVCSDGSWSFDGTTLRFSREIATAKPDSPMPLVLKLKE